MAKAPAAPSSTEGAPRPSLADLHGGDVVIADRTCRVGKLSLREIIEVGKLAGAVVSSIPLDGAQAAVDGKGQEGFLRDVLTSLDPDALFGILGVFAHTDAAFLGDYCGTEELGEIVDLVVQHNDSTKLLAVFRKAAPGFSLRRTSAQPPSSPGTSSDSASGTPLTVTQGGLTTPATPGTDTSGNSQPAT